MIRKGVAIIICYCAITVLLITGAAFVAHSVGENNAGRRYVESGQALWLAESAVNRALYEIRNDASLTGTSLFTTDVNGGCYYVDITISGDQRNITAYGQVPAVSPRETRVLNVVMTKVVPPNFYDNAIYSAGDVDLNGSAYSITGKVRYADSIDNTDNIVGEITQDSTISPLARLDFEQLRTISTAQGNLYDEERLDDGDAYPTTFWYTRGDDSVDNDSDGSIDEADEWVPNVVYVEGDLTLNGNIGTIGGFFVVVGDVINTPDISQDAIINGRGQIEGAIYTRGIFRVNGGGGNLNVNGGVWSGELARLNGNATVTYNYDYMHAIDLLNIDADFQVESWRESNNPWPLTP